MLNKGKHSTKSWQDGEYKVLVSNSINTEVLDGVRQNLTNNRSLNITLEGQR